jgi:ribosome-interacting GTPase 1
MPANLPPQYYALEKDFKKEIDPQEKLRLAKELMAIMPKHKGTEKLQAELKAKISKLNKQIQGGSRKHGARRTDILTHIEKEGAAQIIFIGPPNSGKSSLFGTLTNTQPIIADYPYSTREPMAGMMVYDTVQLQLIDTPPISEEHIDTYLFSLVRQADLVVVVADVCSSKLTDDLKLLFSQLEQKRIVLTSRVPDQIDDPGLAFKNAIIGAHKFLDDGGEAGLEKVKKLYHDFKIVPTSILDDESLEAFKKAIFDSLGVMRVYTKKAGQEPDFNDPIILPVGGTVEDAAQAIHKDFAAKLQYARVWGEGKFEGQKVKHNFVLSDKDIIEFHI